MPTLAPIVGTVAALHRYPVKSMAGERLEEAELRWTGIGGDRQYGVYRADDASGFPWLSARDLSRLVEFRPAFHDPADPRRSRLDVHTPEGEALDVADPALLRRLERETGEALRLLQTRRGAYDAMPVSVVTTATHAAIDATHGAPVDPRRFRSNVIVDSDVREGEWCGGVLQFGDADDAPRLMLGNPIPRCALITIDPVTATRDPAVMRTVAQGFGNLVGAYGSTARAGTIRVGDPVRRLAVG